MTWNRTIQQAFPNAAPEYRAALSLPSLEVELTEAGITKNPMRLAAFFATVAVESGNMRYTRENMNYSKRQIEAVFGVGRHSAAITPGEAAKLERQPMKLAERVYGQGNPHKASELGNNRAGDGWKFRGIGPGQITGRRNAETYMKRLGLESVEDMLKAKNLFSPFILFWLDRGLNLKADETNLREVRRLVNGGYNGYDDFVKEYNRLLVLFTGSKSVEPVKDHSAYRIQTMLRDLGYNIEADGIYGKKTEDAVRRFQRDNGLKVDGIAGPATTALLNLRLESRPGVTPPDVPVLSDDQSKVTGGAVLGTGAVGEVVISVGREMTSMNLDSPLLTLIPVFLMTLGVALIVWPMIRGSRS